MIELLWIPFLVCVLLVLVHVYFGAFVLKRGILFIDLALAQWAALGYVLGHVWDIHEGPWLFLLGFAFTGIAALILTLLRPLYDQVNLQEAVIGVLYIAATAAAAGLISSTGMEGHHLREMLAGTLLFTSLTDFYMAAGLYSIVGLIVFFVHRHFVSSRSQLWDFVFYALFGAVVTSSVKLVGVLLVFAYLVLPILSIVLVKKTLKEQLLSAWVVGIIGSFLGLWLSIYWDIPPSFSVILVLCATWIAFTLKYCFQKRR